MNKINIVFAIPNLQGGGAERVFIHLLRHLDRGRFAPTLLLGSNSGAYTSLVPEDVPVIEIGATRGRAAAGRVLGALRKLQPGIAVGTLGFGILLPALRPFLPARTRIIARLGNTISAENSPSRLRKLTLELALRGADRIVCQSDAMRLDAADYLPSIAPRLVHIYNPVDTAYIEALSKAGESKLQGDPHLLAVGKLHPQKGYDLLLPAIASMRDCFPGIRLTILGDGSERARLVAQRSQLGLDDVVELPGFAENPYAHMKQADFVVSSSRYEGLPNALIEAQALGTPVIATECVGGIREIVQEGVSGILASAVSQDGLASALYRALAMSAEFDRRKIAQIAHQRFGISRIIPAYEGLFESACAR